MSTKYVIYYTFEMVAERTSSATIIGFDYDDKKKMIHEYVVIRSHSSLTCSRLAP